MAGTVIEWFDLQVRQYEDGQFGAIETLSNEQKVGTWAEVKEWIIFQLNELERECPELQREE